MPELVRDHAAQTGIADFNTCSGIGADADATWILDEHEIHLLLFLNPDGRRRAEQGSWFYEMVDLGYNYRLSDLQCALGSSQLKKLGRWVARRREIARRYDAAFAGLPGFEPLAVRPEVRHAYHLYVVRLGAGLAGRREEVFRALRAEGERFATAPTLTPDRPVALAVGRPYGTTLAVGDNVLWGK